MLGGYQQMRIDFVADDPGLTLFHCHMQLHMDLRVHDAVRLHVTSDANDLALVEPGMVRESDSPAMW